MEIFKSTAETTVNLIVLTFDFKQLAIKSGWNLLQEI